MIPKQQVLHWLTDLDQAKNNCAEETVAAAAVVVVVVVAVVHCLKRQMLQILGTASWI